MFFHVLVSNNFGSQLLQSCACGMLPLPKGSGSSALHSKQTPCCLVLPERELHVPRGRRALVRWRSLDTQCRLLRVMSRLGGTGKRRSQDIGAHKAWPGPVSGWALYWGPQGHHLSDSCPDDVLVAQCLRGRAGPENPLQTICLPGSLPAQFGAPAFGFGSGDSAGFAWTSRRPSKNLHYPYSIPFMHDKKLLGPASTSLPANVPDITCHPPSLGSVQ